MTSSDPGPVNVCFNIPGTYTITLQVSNVFGTDTEIKTGYITVYPNPVIDIGSDTTICEGDTLILDAGSGPYTYQWSPSGNTQQIAVTTSGSYGLTVTDPNGCFGRDALYVTVLQQMNASIISNDTLVCENGTAFQLFASDTGGVWNGPDMTNSPAGWFNPSMSGTGVHTVTYSISGICGDTDTISVTVVPLPEVFLGNDTIICTGDTLWLDAGEQGLYYLWSTGDTSRIISVVTSGMYSVTVTDSLQCQSSDSIYIIVTDHLYADIDSVGPFCSNEQAVQLTALDPFGTWSGNGITDPVNGWFDPNVAGEGVHQIVYHISGACGDTDTTEIIVLQAPVINLGNDTVIC